MKFCYVAYKFCAKHKQLDLCISFAIKFNEGLDFLVIIVVFDSMHLVFFRLVCFHLLTTCESRKTSGGVGDIIVGKYKWRVWGKVWV